MPPANNGLNAYKQVDVETASQGKLIVMLLNGAVQRAEEGRRAIEAEDLQGTHLHLIRAQDIIAELRAALNMDAGEIAQQLDRTYEYLHHLLVQANIQKDTAPIDECVEHLRGLRDTWEDVFRQVDAENPASDAPRINPHGNSVINVQG